MAIRIHELLKAAIDSRASDVHFGAGERPAVRKDGEVIRMDVPPLTPDDAKRLAYSMMPEKQRIAFENNLETDFAVAFKGLARFRVNVFTQSRGIGVAMRQIPSRILTMEELGLPPIFHRIVSFKRGLVLLTGPTGSGKSTTLAALVDHINRTRAEHILTIEDPIEFIHEDIMAVISQREVGLDVESYARGLLSALRQDPDVILLGELRDPETIETALVAAETGHLVLSTLHTLDAPETVNRIVAVFEAHKQPQVRNQLARVLRATVSQRLLPRADGQGRALATEVLVTTPYVRDCIADIDKVSLIAGAIASGEHAYGMQNFDQSIFALVQSGVVSVEEAANWVTNVEEFRMRLRGITPGSRSFSR